MSAGQVRKRMCWWLAGLAVVGAVTLTYRLSRPQELVWWTSSPHPDSGRRVHVLVPLGWQLVGDEEDFSEMPRTVYYCFRPVSSLPPLLRRLVREPDLSEYELIALSPFDKEHLSRSLQQRSVTDWRADNFNMVSSQDHKAAAVVIFSSADKAWFDAVDARICASLRIE